MDWSAIFAESLSYADFLNKYATPEQRRRWDAMNGRIRLTSDQSELLSGFQRRMPVVCIAGAWCGDCMNQCPIFEHFAHQGAAIELRFLDREARADVRSTLTINGGARVPQVVILSEDYQEVVRYGERTISQYRKMAAEQLGPSCPTGIVPPSADLIACITSEWLTEFERAQLILRLSPRLRARHGD
jgi:hypothetical protein